MASFPIYQEGSWDHPNGFHIRADVYLTEPGQLRYDVTTFTTSWGLGFTGGTMIALIDGTETVITTSVLRTAGVDARAVWWKPSRRTDHYFDEWVSQEDTHRTARLEIWMDHTPKDRWADILNEIVLKGKQAKDAFDQFKTLFNS